MNILLPIYTVQWFAPWCYCCISYNGLSRDKLVKRVFRSNRHMAYAYPMFCPILLALVVYKIWSAFYRRNYILENEYRTTTLQANSLVILTLCTTLCNFHATKPIFINIEHINSYGFSRTLTASLSLSLFRLKTHTHTHFPNRVWCHLQSVNEF